MFASAVILLSMITYSQAISCYVCTGETEGVGVTAGDTCGDVFDILAVTANLTECANSDDQCYKGKGALKVVNRECMTEANCNLASGINDLVNLFFDTGARAECCTTDGCNSATALQMHTSVIVVPILAIIYMMFH